MATKRINTVQGNTAPPLLLTALRSGVAIDVTGATVDIFIFKGSTQTNPGHTTCTVVTPTSGTVSYAPQAGDFSTPGTYKADLQVTYVDGTVERLYDQLLIKARKKLA
jgi:hypothetical protein